MLAKILLIVIYFATTVFIGFYSHRKASTTEDFVLGGRKVGPWLSAFAYGTTYFSATIFVGYSGQFGWSNGISALWIGLGNALIGSLLAWVLLGRRTRIMTKHLDASTMPQLFATRFDSHTLKIVTSVIIFVFLTPYSASVYKGLSGLFSICFGISFNWCILGMAVLTAIFVVAGGYMGTAANNFIQGIIMFAGIIMIVGAVLNGQGGFTEAISRLSQVESEAAPDLNGAFTSMFGPDPLNLLSAVVLTSLGTLGLPQMVHKFYAIKDEAAIKKGTLISTVFALIIAGGSYFMGGFGRLYYSAETVSYDDIIPTMIASTLPDILVGVVLLVVLSASISTLASLSITASSTIISDFLGSIYKRMSKKTEFTLIRATCALFIALSVVIAMRPSSLITSLMGLSWGALAGAFLGPLIYGLFWRRTTAASVWVSVICGVGFVALNYFFGWLSPTMGGAAAMIASLVIVPVVSLITPKPNREKVNYAFSCYSEQVTVSIRENLDESVETIK